MAISTVLPSSVHPAQRVAGARNSVIMVLTAPSALTYCSFICETCVAFVSNDHVPWGGSLRYTHQQREGLGRKKQVAAVGLD